MGGEWKQVRFADLCEHSAFGPRFSSDDYAPDGNVACLRTMDIDSNGRIDLAAMPLANLDLERFRGHILRSGDLVVTRTGAYLGKAAVFENFQLPVLPGAFSIRFRVKRSIVDPYFLRYYFNSEDGQRATDSIRTGSAQPNINIPNLHSLIVPLPPLPQQRAVVAIVSALDDKIELNRRMNATLEEMAQAIFKSWFVDFDGHTEFEESELGKIPKGWRLLPIDQVADFQNGLALQNFRPIDEEGLPVIKIAQLRSGRPDSGEWASTSIKRECILDDGDVVFSWSGSLLVVLWSGGRGALNQHLFKVTSALYPKWFYFGWLLRHLLAFQSIAADKATTMGHIKRHHLSEAICAVPPDAVLREGSLVMEPLLERTLLNELEIRSLTEIRDTLLPKLTSGEIRVRDAEKIVENVA